MVRQAWLMAEVGALLIGFAFLLAVGCSGDTGSQPTGSQKSEDSQSAEADDFLPQNGKIAFTFDPKDYNRDWEIYTVDPDGSNPSPLPTNIKGVGGPEPAWSPDGTQIAFNDSIGHIWVMDADGSNLRVLTPNRSDLSYRPPVWSPDGTKLAFSASIETSVFNTDIYTMDANGSNMTNVTNTPQLGEDIHDFSPDGSQMCLYRASDDDNTVGKWGIYVMNVDTSNLTRLTKRYEGTEGCAWSPDGTKIAYPVNSGLLAQPGGTPKLNVYVMNADGSKKTNLTSNPEEDDLQATGIPEEDTEPEWSPDGTRIAFSSSRDGGYDYDIYTMDADGSDVTQVTNLPGDEFSPDWHR